MFLSNFSTFLCFPVCFLPPRSMWQEGAASLCPSNLSLLNKEASSVGKNPENSRVFSLNFYGAKSKGLRIFKKYMYKCSNFNTWQTNSVTSYIKRGHLPKGSFLPALPRLFIVLLPSASQVAMKSLCLGF